jgi:hypothetical protein
VLGGMLKTPEDVLCDVLTVHEPTGRTCPLATRLTRALAPRAPGRVLTGCAFRSIRCLPRSIKGRASLDWHGTNPARRLTPVALRDLMAWLWARLDLAEGRHTDVPAHVAARARGTTSDKPQLVRAEADLDLMRARLFDAGCSGGRRQRSTSRFGATGARSETEQDGSSEPIRPGS